jgi:hypothetical protein
LTDCLYALVQCHGLSRLTSMSRAFTLVKCRIDWLYSFPLSCLTPA